jgi:hypothetical protein
MAMSPEIPQMMKCGTLGRCPAIGQWSQPASEWRPEDKQGGILKKNLPGQVDVNDTARDRKMYVFMLLSSNVDNKNISTDNGKHKC